ncbi:MAG TPA: FecR family protein [Pirellulales bacterium]|jgi:ferric-dicitrate binding protein FerR (iron transport regulator)|nr:FecR family protein [Pirellulales bacterium]
MNSQQTRLLDLLDCILDRSYSDSEQQEFVHLVEAYPQLKDDLIEQLRTHSLLQWQSDMNGVAISSAAVVPPMNLSAKSLSNRISQIIANRWVWIAAAIFLMISAMAAWHHIHQENLGRVAVAEVVDNNLVTWSDDSSALLDTVHVVPGKLEMNSGQLTLRFRSGATVWVSGPASMQIVSDMLVKLDRGQATAHVPEWAHGFSIETSNVHVIDLGTKFGVVARPGGTTDVVVFEGQVDLQPTATTALSQKRLNQGEGVRVDNQGSMNRIVEVHSDLRGENWSTQAPSWNEATFKSIRDNIPSDDSPSYYQITPHGLEDDCRAYVDCTHEWNGLTSDGLPDFLMHADYVRTCNDYRYMNNLVITVELARPSNVYVFFDRRVTAPSWLTDQFENTGVDIGLDEGPWWKGDTKHSVGVGGGQSIDRIFSVWRRRCETPETITLGTMGTMKGARAMYGIAAKPLD